MKSVEGEAGLSCFSLMKEKEMKQQRERGAVQEV